MLYHIVLIFLCYCSSLLNGSISDPTPDEIKRAFELLPLPSWGQQAREQNSLRILCVGGSNTANEYENEYPEGRGYVQLLDRFIKSKLSEDKHFRSTSYALNQGRSGVGIDYFIGKKFAFEFHNDTKNWPNVIIVDTSVNFNYSFNLQTFEKFLRSIVYKYKIKGLPCPDIMFYNMIHLRDVFRKKPAPSTPEARAEFITHSYPEDIGNGDSESDDMIRAFAAHYHLPVICWGNATLPAAIRHYTNASFDDVPWRYSFDGVHMSPDLGTQFGIDNLLAPFFRDVLKPRDEVPFKDLSSVKRLYPPETISVEHLSYTTLDMWHSFCMLNMTTIIHNSVNHKSWTVFNLDEHHNCFGSYHNKEFGEIRFHLPEDCTSMDCQLSVGFLHSWNTSMIGNTSCVLSKHDSADKHSVALAGLHIDGFADSDGGTVPRWVNFASNVSSGLHSIKCKNLVENRLSCMVDLMIKGIVPDV